MKVNQIATNTDMWKLIYPFIDKEDSSTMFPTLKRFELFIEAGKAAILILTNTNSEERKLEIITENTQKIIDKLHKEFKIPTENAVAFKMVCCVEEVVPKVYLEMVPLRINMDE